MNKKTLTQRVLFGGYYGQNNVGDDCFGAVSSWGAEKYWNTNQAWLLSAKEIDGPIKTYSCLTPKRYFRGQIICESFWQIMRATCMIWSGGSIFHSQAPFYTPRRFSFLASRMGVTPSGAIGVSLGPYKTVIAEKAVHENLRQLNFLSLRDKKSYDEACSINLPYRPVLAADLAMLLPKIVPNFKPSKSERQILGITVCHYERYAKKDIANEGHRETILLDTLVKMVQSGFKGVFRFFVFNSNQINGDQAVTMAFCDKLKDVGAKVELISYSINPINIWLKVAECTAVISTRLHGAIFAAAANVPCCIVEYHRKCSDFISDTAVAEKWKIGDVNCSSEMLSEKLQDLLMCSPINFYPRREHLIQLAEKNFTFLLEN